MRDRAPRPPWYHPGEGRGPVAMGEVAGRSIGQVASPSWAPAGAGVGRRRYPVRSVLLGDRVERSHRCERCSVPVSRDRCEACDTRSSSSPRSRSVVRLIPTGTACRVPAKAGTQYWAPAFAGAQGTVIVRMVVCAAHPPPHPGDGRGPVAMVEVTGRSISQVPSSSWAPACAGVGERQLPIRSVFWETGSSEATMAARSP